MKDAEHDGFLKNKERFCKDIEESFNKIGSKIDMLNRVMAMLFFISLSAIIICIVKKYVLN